MMYDYVSQYESEDILLEYGCILGNEKIVYIKAGLGGDYLGYENKYLKIARRLHEQYGCSVISASNPNSKSRRIDADKMLLKSFILKQKIEKPQLYFFGNSNGCIKGLELAASGVTFERMILVNMPLMINLHKTKRWLAEIPQTNVIAIYGEKDPSYFYIPVIDGKVKNLKTVKIPGADHNFSGRTDEFISFADDLIEKKE